MSLSAISLKRIFKVGALRLDDPMPQGSLEDSVRILSQRYPQFRSSKLYEEDGRPDPVAGELVFELQLPPPKKNG